MWQPIETAPENQIVDVIFDAATCEDREFYCPSGKVTGVWRRCDVFKSGGKWYASDGLDAMGKNPHQIDRYMTFTHWVEIPKPQAHQIGQ